MAPVKHHLDLYVDEGVGVAGQRDEVQVDAVCLVQDLSNRIYTTGECYRI